MKKRDKYGLVQKIEALVAGRNNALEFSLRDLCKLVEFEPGIHPHPGDVAAALRELGYERVPDGTGWKLEAEK